MIVAAAFTAWLGAAVIVLSDGRRALAIGLALTAAAFSALAWAGGEHLAAAAIFVGGGAAAVLRSQTGDDVWGVMPPGSTPRLILSLAGGLLALWIATSLMTGPGAPARFAALSVLGLMGARILTETKPPALLTALSALALSVAMVSGMSGAGAGPSPYIAAAVVALGVSVVHAAGPDGA